MYGLIVIIISAEIESYCIFQAAGSVFLFFLLFAYQIFH